ncbi:MAG: hypothetical protein IPL39_21555 [Opitutaceae bacterium]|nr:hypothetical protein [Opitutaceae bacterium]MBK8478771.1 hypothetical protein [Opitutaceae bacterium]
MRSTSKVDSSLMCSKASGSARTSSGKITTVSTTGRSLKTSAGIGRFSATGVRRW